MARDGKSAATWGGRVVQQWLEKTKWPTWGVEIDFTRLLKSFGSKTTVSNRPIAVAAHTLAKSSLHNSASGRLQTMVQLKTGRN